MTKPYTVTASSDYAAVAFEMWTRDEVVSQKLKPMLPTPRDVRMALRRDLPGYIELSPEKFVGRAYYDARDPERAFHRTPFYAVAYIATDAFDAGDVDAVRASYFAAVNLLAQHIENKVSALEIDLSPPMGASVSYCSVHPWKPFATRVMFATENPLGVIVPRGDEDAFAAYDMCSDRIAFRLATYLCVVPA